MVTATEAPIRLADCQLRLPTFEGPLDVLLHMIERSQLDITDVSLVLVTDQFVDYVASLQNVPPDLLAEFTAMAARLLLLKSRSLLPAPPREEEEPEPDELTRQLIAYQAVKVAAAHLRERQQAGTRSFSRDPAVPACMPVDERIAPVPLAGLVRALHQCLNRRRPEPKPYTPAPVITLAAMTRRLMSRLRRRARFSALLGDAPTRTEYAVGFIALLSLLRQRVLEATQTTLFGEIEVERIDAVPRAADE